MKIEVSNEKFMKGLVKKYGFTFNEKLQVSDFDFKVLTDDEIIEIINRFFRDEGCEDYIVNTNTKGIMKYICADGLEYDISSDEIREILINDNINL